VSVAVLRVGFFFPRRRKERVSFFSVSFECN
jgi:hypothetical protein